LSCVKGVKWCPEAEYMLFAIVSGHWGMGATCPRSHNKSVADPSLTGWKMKGHCKNIS
jgi:hypothetical protein